MATLIGLPYSPWTEKASWALEHHEVPYGWKAHLPLVGEARLRWLTKRWTGRVTVPVFVDGSLVLPDSGLIARHAEAVGKGRPLFATPGVHQLVDSAEQGLVAARAVGLPRLLDSDAALLSLVPDSLPGGLGGAALPLARAAIKRTMRKYGIVAADRARWMARLRQVLAQLRAGLDASGGEYVAGELSYADIALAQVCNLTFPAPRVGRLRLSAAACRAYWNDALYQDFPRLPAWRDRLYERHRTGV